MLSLCEFNALTRAQRAEDVEFGSELDFCSLSHVG